MRRYYAAVLFVLSIPLQVDAGDNWPAWRGPTGMGLSDEKNLPLTWGGKDNKNVLWKAPLFPDDKVKRDHNQASPIVWGERVFVTVTHWPAGTTEKDFPLHRVLAFSTKNGDKLWDTVVPNGPWKVTDFRGGGYNAPTPATDGERVYVVFGSSVVAALNMQGKIVWRKELTPFHFDVCQSASPVLYSRGDGKAPLVIVVYDHIKDKKSSTIYAFDGSSGDLVWERKRPTVDWAHSTPILANVNGKPQLLTATANGPQALDPANGEILWSYFMKGRAGDTVSPVYRDGVLYMDSGRGGGLGAGGIAVDATGMGDVSSKPLKWKIPAVPSGFSSPLLVGNYLYRVTDPGVITCWKWATGEEVYKERLDGIDASISPVATADGRIYCASAGKSFVLKAGPKLEVLGVSNLGDANRASPALAAGRIYLKGSRFLWCVGR